MYVSQEEQHELLLLHANQQINDLLNTRHITKAARVAVEYGLVSPVSCALVQENNVDNVDAVENPDDSSSNESSEAQSTSEDKGSDNGDSAASADTEQNNGGDTFAGSDAEQSNGGNQDAQASAGQRSAGKSAPTIQGATNGTVGDGSYVTGVNTAGTVRVNNLANLEAMLNIVANLLEVGCGLIGAIIVLHSLANKSFALDMMGRELEISQGQRIAIGVALLLFGLSFPGLLNWFVASARDANLFS